MRRRNECELTAARWSRNRLQTKGAHTAAPRSGCTFERVEVADVDGVLGVVFRTKGSNYILFSQIVVYIYSETEYLRVFTSSFRQPRKT